MASLLPTSIDLYVLTKQNQRGAGWGAPNSCPQNSPVIRFREVSNQCHRLSLVFEVICFFECFAGPRPLV